MKFHVHYLTASGQRMTEICETKNPKDAINLVKEKYNNIKVLQVTMDIDIKNARS
jgi:hypothetical protein